MSLEVRRMAWWKKREQSEHHNWTGPRIRLAEHRDALLEREERRNLHDRPLLSDDEIEAIQRAIHVSLTERRAIALKMYDRFEDLYAIGIVELLDIFGSSFRMNGDWFRVRDVIRVERE